MPEGEDTAQLLARVPLFEGMSDEAVADLASVAIPRSFQQGEVIFREGDEGDTAYVIRSGRVRVTRNHASGRTIALVELRAGKMFGELAMFDHETRSATVEATEPTTVIAILARDLKRVLLRHPDVALKLLSAFADRLRAANERIARQSFQTVPGRVANALLVQVRQQAEDDGDPEPGVTVKATRAELAQLAGTSRESASRFLASLERDGILTCGRGKVTVHEPAALRNYIY